MIDREWVRQQVAQYTEDYPRYKLYAETMQMVLYQVAKKYSPLAIVQSRPKGIASFAEKTQRKRSEFNDPVHQFTDKDVAVDIPEGVYGLKAEI